ncbi:MAG: lysyl-tRNA synthetase, partial [Nocardioidaceae bacterium]|nr:lysyl-tRNA synthetase [Nocardioidaceae bacterium]
MSDQNPPDDLPEQMQVRREKRQRLVDSGAGAYPLHVPRTHTLAEIRATYDGRELAPDTRTGDIVSVAGRVIHARNTGKLCFARLREGDGTEHQVMISLADVGEESLAEYKALVDIGDLVSFTGEVVTSRRGELSVQATAWTMAAKALRPLPNEHSPLSDEARVRLRYVDMIVNQDARDVVRVKAAVLRSLRATLEVQVYLEVEKPTLQVSNGGAAARP